MMKKYILILLFALTLTGCEDNFEEINTNENVPTEANPGNLLTGIIFETVDTPNTYNTNTVNFMMQYMVNIDGGGQFDFRNGYWGSSYAVLGNIIQLENATANDPALLGYTIVGKILKAYNAALLTELYIDVPFSEAGLGLEQNIFPVYDPQQSIFQSILNELDEANTLINNNPDLSLEQGGDIIYDGDLSKWQKLANSLRLRYLLKISNTQNTSNQIDEIVSNPSANPIFESNDDDALIDYTGEFPFIGSFDGLASSQYEIRAASEFYVDLLSQSNDPRLDFFYSLPGNPSINDHRGVPAGLSGTDFDTQFPQGGFDISLLNKRFFDNRGLIDYALMTYSELNFILSEAALKGFISNDAESYYNEAILANIDYWGLTAPTDFLSQPGVSWDGTLDTLINQKWVAAFEVFNFESWSDYKRLALPDFDLPPLTFPSTDGQIPTRMIYPISEQSLNTDNYNAASQNIGGDNSLSQHWYQ